MPKIKDFIKISNGRNTFLSVRCDDGSEWTCLSDGSEWKKETLSLEELQEKFDHKDEL